MKMKQTHRMNRSAKKDAADTKDKSSSRKQPIRSRRRGGAKGDDDDESVDSKGNIRGLIAYSDEDGITSSEEESVHTSDLSSEEEEDALSPKQKKTIRRAARKAAVKARKTIQKRFAKKSKQAIESDSEEEEAPRRSKDKSRKSRKAKKRVETSEEEEEEDAESAEDEDEDDDEDEDENEDEDDDEDDDEDAEEEEDSTGPPEISISFGSFGNDGFAERMIPKRHNMKKESADVKKFVKLVTKPLEANTIDDQIDSFKSLAPNKQKQMLEALEKKPKSSDDNLMFKILTMNVPSETQSLILGKYHSLQALDASSGEYFKLRNWLEKVTSLPLGIYKEIPVKIDDGTEACTSFMDRARRCLEEAIYGQEEAKLQILQFIATKISNPNHRGLSLLLSGPPGIGKTSLIKNGIAKALNWPFQFISLGGDSDATTYTGHQLVYESSHAGKIANSLANAKSMSMVLMFDELDKISTTPKGEEVQNMLIHLTDPVQNEDFEDKYLTGVPLDLSKVMFVFSANDLNKVDKILLDRMMVINLQGYSQKDKLAIAENFLVPTALKEVGLTEKVAISREVLEHMLREYASEETGVRELKRCVEQIAQKINMLRIFNAKELPFYIANFQLPFVVKKEHVDLFLKKKMPSMDVSVQRMYT
jgi:ATP-dependent Lon protease